MKPKKVLGIVAIALVAYAVFTNPNGSADMVGGVGDWLGNSADSVMTFLKGLGG